MELSCMWMRRAGANCLLVMRKPLTDSITQSPFTLPSLNPHIYPPQSFNSLRSISISARACFASSASCRSVDVSVTGINSEAKKVLLKGMNYTELEKWVQSHGYRPGQALMLWKRLYGDNIWAHCSDELEGLNKDFRKMLGELAEFKALSLKDVLTASDGTRKDVADSVHIRRWLCNRNSCDSL